MDSSGSLNEDGQTRRPVKISLCSDLHLGILRPGGSIIIIIITILVIIIVVIITIIIIIILIIIIITTVIIIIYNPRCRLDAEVLASELPREDFHANRWRCIVHPERAAPWQELDERMHLAALFFFPLVSAGRAWHLRLRRWDPLLILSFQSSVPRTWQKKTSP